MMIAIVFVAVMLLHVTSRLSQMRMNRADKLELDVYEHKARCEGSLPFDYLTR